MKNSRYATSRQKSCNQCSLAKVKCDRAAGQCGRCQRRGLPCEYRQMTDARSSRDLGNERELCTRKRSKQTLDTKKTSLTGDLVEWNQSSDRSDPVEPKINQRDVSPMKSPDDVGLRESIQKEANDVSDAEEAKLMSDAAELDFSNLQLICPINPDDITNRWIKQYIPDPNGIEKTYSDAVILFISRMLKSYADTAISGQSDVPFIHPTQLTQLRTMGPLVRCLSLLAICRSRLPGSEDIATTVLTSEMATIMNDWSTYDDISLLSAFQAYLIYILVLFFRLGRRDSEFIASAMVNVQNLARVCCNQGLISEAEQRQTRPRWEEWLVTEIKMRTLYVMYFLDTVVSAQENLPTYLAVELHGLPVSSPKSLWRAASRVDWIYQFNNFLTNWSDSYLRIEELWPESSESSELKQPVTVKRRTRIDKWLENIDEFGIMLYAVVCHIHNV